MRKIVVIIIIILFSQVFNIYAGENKEHIYSTWDVIELDTCASAWLIKRFVDTKAQFKFYPKGEFITEGIPFDTPDAELRRRQGMSTFESILDKYKIKDPRALKIGKIIHEIEINYWGVEVNQEGKKLNDRINEIITNNKNPEQIIEEAFKVIDEFYNSI